MTDGTVRLERRDKVALVTLDRPEKRNALNTPLWSGMAEVAAQLADDLPRAIVLTGAPPAFCAGMDVSPQNPQIMDIAEGARTGDVERMRKFLDGLRPSIDALVGLPVPLIAAVNGLAYGGGAEIATRCDLRVFDAEATICFSEVRLGLMPDMGGCVALPRVVGRSRAMDLILSARKVGAEEAARLGLADRVAPAGRSVEVALELAEAIAANGPRAVRTSLALLRRVDELDEAAGLAAEHEAAAQLIASGECVAGVTAFAMRQKPQFVDP